MVRFPCCRTLFAAERLSSSACERMYPAENGRRGHQGKVPVTGIDGEYGPGRVWFPTPADPLHLQADGPVAEPGWYGLRATTAGGRTLRSDEYPVRRPDGRQPDDLRGAAGRPRHPVRPPRPRRADAAGFHRTAVPGGPLMVSRTDLLARPRHLRRRPREVGGGPNKEASRLLRSPGSWDGRAAGPAAPPGPGREARSG